MPAIYYSPATNLERIDAAIIAQAHSSIDMAAFALTDRDVIGAPHAAADCGVAVPIHLDADQVGVFTRSAGYLQRLPPSRKRFWNGASIPAHLLRREVERLIIASGHKGDRSCVLWFS